MAIGLTIHPPAGGEPTELTFEQQRVRIGRGAMCDLRIPHRTVSSVHSMIFLEGDRYFLVDPGSTNGTMLNGEMLVIQRRKLLRSGDIIGVAGFEVHFRAGVAMVSHDCRDRTAAVARYLARHVLMADGEELRGAALIVMAGPQEGQRFEIATPPCTMNIGRDDDNHVILDDREVSRRHVALDVTAEGVVARDLGSKNPLLINDQPVGQHRLKDRDELLIGATRLVFDEPLEGYLRELAQLPDAPVTDRPEKSVAEKSGAQTSRETPMASSKSSEDLPSDQDDLDGSEEAAVSIEAAMTDETVEDAQEPASKEGGSLLTDPFENARPRRERGLSTGTEIAVLFVGVLALAICIFALIWIFH